MLTDPDELWQLLRSLDDPDPDHFETPPGYLHYLVRRKFKQLIDRLNADFDCRCNVDFAPDGTRHGRIEIPDSAAASGGQLVLSVSNFGNLVVLSVENPGAWSDDEAAVLLHPDDARRIHSALDDLGYVLIPEDPLWQRYDGTNDRARMFRDGRRSWWDRYFEII